MLSRRSSGRPQDLGGAAMSVLLFWLGTLCIFGIATLLSVVFNDVLRPLGLAVVILIVLNLPGLFPHGADSVNSFLLVEPARLPRARVPSEGADHLGDSGAGTAAAGGAVVPAASLA